MERRLLLSVLVHGVCGAFADILALVLNLLNAPIRRLLVQSFSTNYFPLDESGASLLVSCVASLAFVGLFVGFLSIRWFMQHFGRKQLAVYARCSVGLFSCVCMLSASVWQRWELYALAHLLTGVAASWKMVLIVYVSECSPDKHRGMTTILLNTGMQFVVLCLLPLCRPSVLGDEFSNNWMVVPLLAAFLAICHILIGHWLPQSPKQLYIRDHDFEGATKAIHFYFGADAEMDEVLHEYERERMQEMGFGSSISVRAVLEHPVWRPSLILVLLAAFVAPLSAFNVKSQFQVAMFESWGIPPEQTPFILMGIALVTFPLGFLAPWFVERLGRRPLFVAVCLLCSIEWFLFGVAQLVLQLAGEPSLFTSACAVIASCTGHIAVMFGLLVLSPMLLGEICPMNTRPSIAQLSQTVPMVLAVAQVASYTFLVSLIGAGFHFLSSLSCLGAGMALVYLLPETKGLSTGRIAHRLSVALSRRGTLHSVVGYGSCDDSSSSSSSSLCSSSKARRPAL